MKIAQINPGILSIPPKKWGAVEEIIWQYKINFEKLGHTVDIKYSDELSTDDDYDLIHLHLAKFAVESDHLEGGLVHRQIPYIFTMHDVNSFLAGRESRAYIDNEHAIKGSEFSTIGCKTFRDVFSFSCRDKLEWLLHGVDTDFFKPAEAKGSRFSGQHRLLCVGMKEPRKQFHLAIEAAQILDLPITIVGPEHDGRKEYILKYFSNNKYDKLTLIKDSDKDKLREIHSAHTILVHPSLCETGNPCLAVMEAMSSGLPVVGTNMDDYYNDHQDGFPDFSTIPGFVNCINDAENIAQGIKILIEDYDNRSKAARNFALEHSWPKVCKRILDIFEKRKAKDRNAINPIKLTSNPSLLNNMKLSIVTSFYNSENYIEEQSASILSQTYNNWEWIIADDFSTDNTKQKLVELEKKDSRIRLVELSHKKQLWWNPQLFASGDLVCHIDGDDIILPKTFEKIIRYFGKFPEVVLMHFNANKYKELLPQSKDQLFDNFVNNVYISNENNSFLEGFEKLWCNRSGVFGCLRVFKNLQNLKFEEHSDEGDCSSNDGQWLLTMEEKGRTLTIPRTTYLAREHYDSENFRNWNIKGEVNLIKESKERRKNIYLTQPRKIDYFDDIYKAAESTYLSQLNWETEIKNISFINFDYNNSQKEKLRDLFFDHSVSFDNFKADYYFIIINCFNEPEQMLDIAKKLLGTGRVTFFCDNCHLQKNNRSDTDNLTIFKDGLEAISPFYFLLQENRAYFIYQRFEELPNKSMKEQLLSIYKKTPINHIDACITPYRANVSFVDGPKVDIKSETNNQEEYLIEFENKNTKEVLFSSVIKNNMWTRPNLKCFIEWKINIKEKTTGNLKEINFCLKNQRVLIHLDSKSLGDNIAWVPYVEEFRKKHDCYLICSCFKKELFEKSYPDIEFVEPGISHEDLYASYQIGWFDDWVNTDKNPIDPRTISLQQTATDILGLDYKEIKPRVDVEKPQRPIKEKYICISTSSTAGCKHWQNPTGWQDTVDYLNGLGFKVVVLQKESLDWMDLKGLKNVEHPNTENIQDVVTWLNSCEFFIGIGSGVSWLAWALNKKVVLISGFSKALAEFHTPYRVINEDVCNGCWNDKDHKFDRGDWNWCPEHKNTDKHFECSKSITFKMVEKKIEQITKNTK